jgi:site-specific DNA-methyltransferase (adenine-specific)
MGQMGRIICGNSAEVLNTFENNTFDLTVTSPPYDNLRDYNKYEFDFEAIASQLFRVTKEGGVVVWVVGDATVKGSETGSSFRHALYFMDIGFKLHDTMIYEKNGTSFPAKRTGNRYSQIFEYMFVLSNGVPKTHNLICDKANRWAGQTTFGTPSIRNKDGTLTKAKGKVTIADFSARNNIWRYNTGKGYSTKDVIDHPAIFPEELAKDHILTWSNPGDVVLDPFSGSGTTAKMAKELGRDYVGIDISQEYVELARKRIGE